MRSRREGSGRSSLACARFVGMGGGAGKLDNVVRVEQVAEGQVEVVRGIREPVAQVTLEAADRFD
jgi:hypothetical protein